MDRKEQIRNKAKELGQQYFPDEANIWARGNIEAEYVECACVEMAKWLDQHPNWIPVEDELPKEKGAYLFHFDDGQTRVEGYFPELHLSKCVTHWMEIQPPRKEDKK